jgi:hypothetical protein
MAVEEVRGTDALPAATKDDVDNEEDRAHEPVESKTLAVSSWFSKSTAHGRRLFHRTMIVPFRTATVVVEGTDCSFEQMGLALRGYPVQSLVGNVPGQLSATMSEEGAMAPCLLGPIRSCFQSDLRVDTDRSSRDLTPRSMLPMLQRVPPAANPSVGKSPSLALGRTRRDSTKPSAPRVK